MPPPLPGPEPLIFVAGVLGGMAIMFVMMAPLMAKGLEAHHHLPPSRSRRRRIILAYNGLAVAALCLAGSGLSFGMLLQPILLIVGLIVGLVSGMALTSARENRQRAQPSDQQDVPGGSPEANGPPAT